MYVTPLKSNSAMEQKKRCFKTWLVETAWGIWASCSFIGITLVEGMDGSVKLFPFCIPSLISLVISAKVFDKLQKKGYFPEHEKKEVKK